MPDFMLCVSGIICMYFFVRLDSLLNIFMRFIHITVMCEIPIPLYCTEIQQLVCSFTSQWTFEFLIFGSYKIILL